MIPFLESIVVTVDGPAASGKTSVSREVARRLGWRWVSTGAFYRGLAFVAKSAHIDIKDESIIIDLHSKTDWEVKLSPDRTQVFLRGEDVTEDIYREDIGELASQISHFPQVRAHLLQAQRDCALGAKGLVAEGRDCGSIVFPQAWVKIFLDASTENRAERRVKEQGGNKEKMKESQARRDQQDSSRQVAPLCVPKGAHVINTSDLTLEEVVDVVENIVRQNLSLNRLNKK